MRTASLGGSLPSVRNRRTLLYDAVSTSIEKVESGCDATVSNGLSMMWAYFSVLGACSEEGGAALVRGRSCCPSRRWLRRRPPSKWASTRRPAGRAAPACRDPAPGGRALTWHGSWDRGSAAARSEKGGRCI